MNVMNTEIHKVHQQHKRHLSSSEMLRYLICSDDTLDGLIMCKSSEIPLTTTDQELYEAMGSVRQYDNVKLNKLVKLLEVTEIQPVRKTILRDEHVEELRKIALRN